MPIIIPMKDLPSFTEEVTLDNLPYILRFDFNSRGEFWVISFYTRDTSQIVVGIVMVLNFELINRYPDRGLPPGELWVFDATGGLEEPGRDDFINGRLELIYYLESELEI